MILSYREVPQKDLLKSLSYPMGEGGSEVCGKIGCVIGRADRICLPGCNVGVEITVCAFLKKMS